MNKTFFKNINNWQDFDDKLSSLGNKEKGDAFELLTKCYFKIKPQYNHYDEVWLLDEVPQNELDYLKITDEDFGIDLIAKEGKEYYAIQCKYHGDKNQNITFKEVSTFLQQVESNKKITMGYICSSANGTSKNYQKVQKKEIQEILIDSWQLLDKAFFDNVRKLLNNKAVKEKPFKPRKHQKKAVKQALNHFVKENNSRGKLIFPCGSGKSLTGYWLSEALESKSTLIAVPSLSLVKQTLEVYLREIVANGIKVKWLCICSDEGIGASDDVAIMTNNIGVPCKTDPEYIRAWLKENKHEHKIIFTTYQSGHLIADISKKLKLSFDLGIFDEAHKTVGSNLKKFSYLLFEKNIKIDKRIFMTATERFYSGSKEDIISMDDEDVYGDTFAHMSFKEAIDLDLLTDYKVITIDIKKSEIAEFIRDNDLVKLNSKWKRETDARSLASMLAMRKAMKRFNIKNVVSFHSSIEKAKRSKELQEYITATYNYKPIDTYTVSGKIPTTKRNIIVQEFAKSERALITNARCLTEGIDVPNIDCIVFADPKKSKVDIVQALGRALRKKEGKEWGYVILPVVYDGDTNEIDNDSFNEIINIVRGLAANDERIVEYFKDKAQKGKGSGEMIKGSDIFSLDSSMLEEKDLASQLQIKIWEKLSKFQWTPFEEAREYVHKLNLRSSKEWFDWCKNKREDNIPTSPNTIYRDKGWDSFGDWLGTNIIAPQYIEYKDFKDARNFVHKLKLRNQKEWRDYCTSGLKPQDIPSNAGNTYRNKGWKGLGDWIGTGRIANQKKKYVSFSKAKIYAARLKLKNNNEWREYVKSSSLVEKYPSFPEQVYKKEWKGWGDFLGNNNVHKNTMVYLPFQDARKFARSLGLKTTAEWKAYCKSAKKPKNIPTAARSVYKDDGWISMGDWLGTDSHTRVVKPIDFDKLRLFVHKLKLGSREDWHNYFNNELANKGNNIPKSVASVYKNKGWKGWKDFLGKKRMTYNEAKKYIIKYGIKSQIEWNEFKKSDEFPEGLPRTPYGVYKNNGWVSWGDFLGNDNTDTNVKNIPVAADKVYKGKGWKSWGDWLGTGRDSTNTREFVSYSKLKVLVSKLDIKSQKEWNAYWNNNERPKDIPRNPQNSYKEFISWGDFLETGRVANQNKKYKSFKSARIFIRKLKLASNKEWREYWKNNRRPDDIPAAPDRIYKDDWKGWGDFLGTGRISDWEKSKKFWGFTKARNYVRRLNLKTKKEYKSYLNSHPDIDFLPKNPNEVYENEGWAGVGDWLGIE